MYWMLLQVDPVVDDFIERGVLGLVIVAIMLGWLAPRWILDEYRKREAVKDNIIERLTAAVEAIEEREDVHHPKP